VPSEHRVAVYIYVNGGWWTKPFRDAPLTSINCDGLELRWLFLRNGSVMLEKIRNFIP
jgi:hypothetical protein